MSFWNEAREALLEKLCREGLSDSQIALQLGEGCTKNMVVGKRYRLELPTSRRPGGQPISALRPKPKPQPQRLPACSAPPGIPDPLAPVVCEAVELGCVGMLELRECHCRWPIGDPSKSTFRFCGAKKQPGRTPYCGFHHAVAFPPQIQNRRRSA